MSLFILMPLVFITGEILASILFYLLNKKFKVDSGTPEIDWMSISKGILERFVLLMGLMMNFPHILILFGALKIGTRIRNEEKVSNDYFFIGNIISVLFVLIYYLIYTKLI